MAGRDDLYRDGVGSYRIVYRIRRGERKIAIVRAVPRKDDYKGI